MSQTWMMWLDGDTNKTTEEVVREAIDYYQGKYGVKPNRVQIPLNIEDVYVEGVHIERESYVQKNHLLVTVDGEIKGRKTETGGKGGR
jgi:hypothetical protein